MHSVNHCSSYADQKYDFTYFTWWKFSLTFLVFSPPWSLVTTGQMKELGTEINKFSPVETCLKFLGIEDLRKQSVLHFRWNIVLGTEKVCIQCIFCKPVFSSLKRINFLQGKFTVPYVSRDFVLLKISAKGKYSPKNKSHHRNSVFLVVGLS